MTGHCSHLFSNGGYLSVGIHGSIYGRIKHTYSIYRKMRAQNKTIDELYDLYAFRVIVDNIADCYNVLGHIHDLFNPIPGRFKDYISTPKPNMYQSLHTTVIGGRRIPFPFEIQIRTWEMHETAEYGIAAHWKYKQGTGSGSEKDFEGVRRLLESQQDADAGEYVQSLKIDMFDDEVFVFTPKGEIIVTFLALLELLRQHRLIVYQNAAFHEITIVASKEMPDDKPLERPDDYE